MKVGDKVLILFGPYKGQVGIIDCDYGESGWGVVVGDKKLLYFGKELKLVV